MKKKKLPSLQQVVAAETDGKILERDYASPKLEIFAVELRPGVVSAFGAHLLTGKPVMFWEGDAPIWYLARAHLLKSLSPAEKISVKEEVRGRINKWRELSRSIGHNQHLRKGDRVSFPTGWKKASGDLKEFIVVESRKADSGVIFASADTMKEVKIEGWGRRPMTKKSRRATREQMRKLEGRERDD